MFERLLRAGVLDGGSYLGIDADPANIAAARAAQPIEMRAQVRFECLDYRELPARAGQCDLLVAHAFLDLLDLQSDLAGLLELLKPGGWFYFPITYDGVTIFEPELDVELEETIIRHYNRSMDTRQVDGRRSGDSRAGRHLLEAIPRLGAQILAAGASDWIVQPNPGNPSGYPADERYFLEHILHFFEETLMGRPELDQDKFQNWLARRRIQIDRAELMFIAHQLDVAGQRLEAASG